MCGFAGFVDAPPRRPADELRALVEAMARRVAHRGPDDAAAWVDEAAGVALGFRRLAILDRSTAGRQPMTSASGRWVIVLNGEIYNFGTLRRELADAGMLPPLGGRSDTEIALAAIEAWGVERAVERFVGMFAFALWDRDARRLHLVRDRLGIKPLYYARVGTSLLFGSELRALTAHPALEPVLDRDAVARFLRHGHVPAPAGIVRHTRKLPPGTILSLGPAAALAGEPRAYWSLGRVVAEGLAAPFPGSFAEAVDELERLLTDAVRLRAVADVPLGVLLSGGTDSTIVTALLQRVSARPARTFTIGVAGCGYDESAHAARVAAHLGSAHTALRVTGREALDVVARLGTLQDEPFADASQIPTYLVAALARRDVTVVLAGDGGDELLGGYARYAWLERLWGAAGGLPISARRGLACGLETLPAGAWRPALAALQSLAPRSWRVRSPGEKVLQLARILRAPTPEAMYAELMATAPVNGAAAAGLPLPPRPAAPLPDLVQRLMFADTIGYLPDDVLVKVDRMTMAVGLEAREPLLDHRVVEFLWRLPLAWKRDRGRTKRILHALLARYVPPALLARPKHGFSVPIAAWLRGPLRAWADDLLAPASLARQDALDGAAVSRMWQAHRTGRRDHGGPLWNVLMLQAWLEAGRGMGR